MNGLHYFCCYIFSGGAGWKNHLTLSEILCGSFLKKKLMIEGCNHPFSLDVFLGETCRVFLGFPRISPGFPWPKTAFYHREVHLLRREVAWLQQGESRTQRILAFFFGCEIWSWRFLENWVVVSKVLFIFTPNSLGKWSNVTRIFLRWVVQPPTGKKTPPKFWHRKWCFPRFGISFSWGAGAPFSG